MCIYMCVKVVLINILASHLAPQTKIPSYAPDYEPPSLAWLLVTIGFNGLHQIILMELYL